MLMLNQKEQIRVGFLSLLKDFGKAILLVLPLLAVVLVAECATAEAASPGLGYSPEVYLECLPRDTYTELDDHLPEWGFKALEIIAHYDDQRHLWSAQDGADCGNLGSFHLQQPDPFDLNMTSLEECPWDDDPEWRDWVIAIAYSDYSAELQAAAWLDIVGPTVQLALDAGATDEEAAGVAAMANSAPRLVRQWAAERGWGIEGLLAAYLEHRDTAHRRRRVDRIRNVLDERA